MNHKFIGYTLVSHGILNGNKVDTNILGFFNEDNPLHARNHALGTLSREIASCEYISDTVGWEVIMLYQANGQTFAQHILSDSLSLMLQGLHQEAIFYRTYYHHLSLPTMWLNNYVMSDEVRLKLTTTAKNIEMSHLPIVVADGVKTILDAVTMQTF